MINEREVPGKLFPIISVIIITKLLERHHDINDFMARAFTLYNTINFDGYKKRLLEFANGS